MTAPTVQLRTLARRLSDTYVARGDPRAILLVGSAATGGADAYSDLDLLVYYDRVPPAETLGEVAGGLGVSWYRATPWSDESGEPDEHGVGERFGIGGIECQVAHVSVGAFEREIHRLAVDLELDEELLKIMSGLFEGEPLHGAELVERWRALAAFTPELQRAMIRKRWKFFPWWFFQERLRSRDALAWRHEILAQSVYAIVGALAALNHLYFSTFEFKRAGRFVARLEIAPANLAARLDSLFELDEPRSTAELEQLVAETAALIATHLPDVDLSLEWAGKSANPGERETPWA